MKTLKISIIILVLLMSVGAVCATNATSDDNIGDDNDQNILETTINDISSVNEPKTFTDLDKDISNSTDVFDMQDNYKFNNASDNGTGGVIIDKENFVINGNNHIIDANGQSAIFAIKASNVTINNLTFINANSGRGSVFDIDFGCSLTTNNVNFINNTAINAAIMVKGTYNSNNDKFTDSSSEKFGVIYLYMNTVLNINNAVMTTSKLLEWGFIYTESENSTITILDSMFANITSNYSAAVKGTTKTVIRNTKFINLHSLLSAGAICVKNIEDAVIDNCEFINVTSERNAGVIMADVYIYNTTLPVVIRNSKFVNSYSEFGGAIMQLGGSLTVDNCTFINSTALFDGGAIYTSLVYVNISNSKFYGSKTLYDIGDRGTYGGAIFCDNSELRLVNCELINGSAQYGGAIYLYDGDYNISNNVFSGNVKFNGDFDDIYSVFDDPLMTIIENNVYSGAGSCNLNNTNYDTIMAVTGMKLVRLNNTIDVSSIPSKFDLRDWGWSTPVKDQGRTGSCWTFGSSGAIESAILRYLGISMDVSENNMLDLSLQYSPFGTLGMEEGGSLLSGVVYTLSWFGILPSRYDSYDQVGKVSPIFATNETIHFQDVVFILPRNNVTDNDVLKRAVLEYGAVAVGYAADQQPPQLNPETSAQYSNESEFSDHCVALIGWDDNYSKDNFLITPPGDGAWIIKNSWGVDNGDNGYYYISYYDVNFATADCSMAYLIENTVEYNKNYQYDIGGSLMFVPEGNEYWNEYTALDDDLIAAVGTYFNDTNVEYSIEIYVDDLLVLEQNGVSPFAGFHTIKLDSYVPIKKGENFSVLIKSNSIPLFTASRQYYMSMSSIAYIGGEWVDLASVREVASIKVYTVVDNTKIINNKDISVDYDGGSYFSVKVVTVDGHAVGAGEKVKFTINGKSKTVSTDANGIAKIKITDVPKKYILTTTYKGKSVKNTVTVKQVLTSSKVTAKKTAKKFTLQAKLKINGKLIKGKKITFKFNGKSYKAKTNAKGVAKVTVKKNVIKKLKKGKTYTVKVTYSKDTIKTTVKVK